MSQLSHAAKNMEICQDAHATRADGNKRFPLAKYRAVGLIWKNYTIPDQYFYTGFRLDEGFLLYNLSELLWLRC